MIRTTRTRRGATLVEVMVAAAMLILGMWLLVWLYQQGMASFLQAKAASDLTTQQRTVATVLARDLGASIFIDEDAKPNRGRRVSDQRTDLVGSGWTPPRGGYFSARSRAYGMSVVTATPVAPATNPPTYTYSYSNSANTYEATDSDGFVTGRSVDHFLQFTILLPGGSSDQLIGAEIPVGSGTQYSGTAAEVTYALVPNGLTTPGGLALYDLIRRQRLTAYTNDDTPIYQTAATNAYNAGAGDNVYEVMTANVSGTTVTMQNLLGLTAPSARLQAAQWALPSTSSRYGEERLMTNVLSFEVKFTGPQATVGLGAFPSEQPAVSSVWPRPFSVNTDYPYDFLPFDGQFDTYSTTASPAWNTQVASVAAPTGYIKPIRLTGVMIRLRAYDPKNQATRQTTISSAL
jgi:Tfp pilus assembly protein PilV